MMTSSSFVRSPPSWAHSFRKIAFIATGMLAQCNREQLPGTSQPTLAESRNSAHVVPTFDAHTTDSPPSVLTADAFVPLVDAAQESKEFLAALTKEELENDCEIPNIEDKTVPTGVTEKNNITYRTTDHPRWRFDVAYPERAGSNPTVVLVHGGGWTVGDKKLFRRDIRRLAVLGYTAVAVNYRLAKPSTKTDVFPAAPEDLQCALRSLAGQGKQLHIDAKRIVLLGASAGAHLAALVATAPDLTEVTNSCLHTNGTYQVKGVVAYYGPFDLSVPQDEWPKIMQLAIVEFLGVSPTEDRSLSLRASVQTYLSASTPPMLLHHSNNDKPVPIKQSERLADELEQHKVRHSLIRANGAGHGFAIFGQKRTRKNSCATLAFLKKYIPGAVAVAKK